MLFVRFSLPRSLSLSSSSTSFGSWAAFCVCKFLTKSTIRNEFSRASHKMKDAEWKLRRQSTTLHRTEMEKRTFCSTLSNHLGICARWLVSLCSHIQLRNETVTIFIVTLSINNYNTQEASESILLVYEMFMRKWSISMLKTPEFSETSGFHFKTLRFNAKMRNINNCWMYQFRKDGEMAEGHPIKTTNCWIKFIRAVCALLQRPSI